ncbi:MAG: bifunctional salicylyl-CoA 5-hydroxylase/oxidoreductase, partial [Gammaproteobacteria bacterium]|nr:bifunctional salicylyl-CoA 5-hydroxylase/oxidoreductase [Gammaproteobacteria bacterium]
TFPVVRNERLYYRNIVLMGDAVRSAHFSIGSGTKLAMEDAISLASYFDECGNDVGKALAMYQDIRKDEADRLQRTAVVSLSWFEHIDRYAASQEAEQFTFNMMCRAKRITYENLRLRDPDFIARIDRWFAKLARESTGFDDIDVGNPVVPVFQPFKIGNMRVENRFQLSAMCQYCAEDGNPTDWHLMHYGERAVGGTGLLNTEMLCISPDARITPGCAGIWSDEQVEKWAHIIDFVHTNSKARFCAQVGHSGRKGATCVPWDGGIDEPLPKGAWEIIGPSPLPYLEHSVVPREMNADDMASVMQDFLRAARNADAAGFDMIEVHLAHGYLLSSFISPVTNRRSDEYGGDIASRMKYPLQVVAAMKEVWPTDKPMSVRISATDWVEDGLTEAEMLAVAAMLKDAGVDIINVSTGQVTKDEDPIYGRMFQAPFADQVRNEVGIPTIVAGNISSADQANTLVAAGRTDIVAFGRAIMNEPHFVLTAAAHYGHTEQYWAPQYLSGKLLAEIMAAKDNQEMLELRSAAKPPNPGEALAIAVARGEVLQKE